MVTGIPSAGFSSAVESCCAGTGTRLLTGGIAIEERQDRSGLLHPLGGDDGDLGGEALLLSGRALDAEHDVHAADDLAEGRKALAVGIALPSVVEGRLIADADEEAGSVENSKLETEN